MAPVFSNQENRGFSGFLPTFGRQEISKVLCGLGEILGKTKQPPGFSWLLPVLLLQHALCSLLTAR